MKKTLLILAFMLSAITFAQTNGITYQAVIYNANGESVPGINNTNAPLSNKAICIEFSIIDEDTQIEYAENIKVTTDAFGMVNLIIGNGSQTGGYANSFDAVIWSSSKKYLKVSLDQSGSCNAFDEISNQVLNYVPFALAANTATSVSGIIGIANGGTNASTIEGAKTNLQLQNVDNTSDLDKPIASSTQLVLDTKVDKVAGKNLSTEDFTTAEKTKLASLGGTQDLSLLAPLLSPNFTGIPIAPTAAAGTNTSQIATTAFVNSTVASATNANYVNLAGNQTVSGNKTFNNNITINSILVGKGSGIQSTLFGNAANATKDNTTAIGFMSLNGNSGISNTSVGTNAMRNSGLTSMSTAIGEGSGTGVTTGSGNTFLGHSANVTNNSAIENATSIGYQALVTSSNTIQLGNSNVTDVKTNGSYTGTGFKTLTGTSSQYLMADGSVSSGSSGSTSTSASVDLTTNQTIAGSKTFSSDLNVSGLTIGGTLNATLLGANVLGGPFSTTIGNNASSPSSYSVAIGRNSNAMSSYSLAIGGLAAKASESYSLAIGGNAPEATGVYSTAIGGSVPKATALQSTALGSTTTASGQNSTALGYGATVSSNNTIQLGNTAITNVNTSGSYTGSGFKTTTGTSSQYLMADGSVSSGSSLTSGVPYTGATGSVDLGMYDLKVNGLTVGIGAGAQPSNVVIGKSAMENNSTGGYSVAVGFEALKSITNGNSNTAVGFQALKSNTTGGANIAIGMNAMLNNINGSQNIAIGQSTLNNNTSASGNTVIGHSAGVNISTGGSNTIIGQEAAGGLTTGSWNTIIGRNTYTGNISNNIVLSNGQGAIKAQHDGNGWKFTGRMVMSTATIDYSELNNYDVSNISILFVKPNSTWTNIYGLTGGVLGQVIDIYSVNNQTSNCCSGLSLWNFDSSSNSGTQKFVAPGGINIDSNKNTTLVFDGTYWRVSKLGGM
jgi:hypothetical protein